MGRVVDNDPIGNKVVCSLYFQIISLLHPTVLDGNNFIPINIRVCQQFQGQDTQGVSNNVEFFSRDGFNDGTQVNRTG